MRRQRRHHLQRRAGAGMGQTDRAGMQMQLARQTDPLNHRFLAAIFPVTENRRPEQQTMRPQLVGPTGARFEFQPSGALESRFNHPVIGHRAESVLLIDPHLLDSLAAKLGQRGIDPSLAQLGHAHHQRPIAFTRGPTLEGRRQLGGCPRIPPEQQHPRGVLVETMDQTRPLRRIKTERIQHRVEMMIRHPGAALHRQTRRLVEDDHIGIAIQHGRAQSPGHRLIDRRTRRRRHRRRIRGQRRNPDALAGAQALTGLNPAAIDPDLPGPQPFFQ